VLATVVMWPAEPLDPGPGIDPSWTTGLALAHRAGLQFGPDIVFTYGPLGYALFPSNVARSGLVVSLVVLGAICGSFAVITARVLRSSLQDHRLALAGAAFIAVLGPSTGAAICDVAVLAPYALVAKLIVDREVVAVRWNGIIAGASAALLLTKVTAGFVVAVPAVVLCVVGGQVVRRALVASASFIGTLVALWLLLGQHIGNLAGWLADVVSISSGYSWAMGVEERGRRWELVLALAIGIVVIVVAVRRTWRWHLEPVDVRRPIHAVVSLWVLAGALYFFVFKEGFVRHDIHSGVFFFAVVYAIAVLTPWHRLQGRRAPAAAAWAVALLALVTSGGGSLTSLLDPSPAAAGFFRVGDQLVSPGDWRSAIDTNRASLVAHYALPDSIVEAMRGQTVHIDPFETSVVWAYDLRWQPTPVFQRYQSYTPRLDAAGADRLADPGGPQLVLRHSDPTIDGRFGLLEAPETSMAILCGFAPLSHDGRWDLLARTTDRCGSRTELEKVVVGAGESIEVPAIDPAHEALLVQIDFDIGIVDRIEAALFRADEYTMTVDETGWRVLPQAVVHAGPLYVPPSAGWGDGFRALVEPPLALRLDHPATVTFSSVRIGP